MKIRDYLKMKLNNYRQKRFEGWLNIDRLERLEQKALPFKALFNVSNICTSNCVFCAYQYNLDQKTIMSNELFEKCVAQFSALQPESLVSLTPLIGEPFTDKEIFKKIEIARQYDIKEIEIYTNASLLKDYVDDILSSSIDLLHISFPDFNEEEFKLIFRTDRYRDSLEGIHELLRKHKETNSHLRILINMRGRKSKEEVFKEPDFIKYIEPFLDRIKISFIDKYDNWGGIIKQEDLPPGMFLEDDFKKAGSMCKRLFKVMFLANGDVKFCGSRCKETIHDELTIGNIYQNSLSEIWFGHTAKFLRQNYLNGDYPDICKDCTHFKPLTFLYARKND